MIGWTRVESGFLPESERISWCPIHARGACVDDGAHVLGDPKHTIVFHGVARGFEDLMTRELPTN